MDRKTLYEKVEKAFNQAFEAAKHSAKVVSEKAGEAAQITRLLIEKATLEHRVTKKFAQIGSHVYESASKGGDTGVQVEDEELKTLIAETQKLEGDLAEVESRLEKEKKQDKKPEDKKD